MGGRDDGDSGPFEVRRIMPDTIPAPPEPEPGAVDDGSDEHDGWQPVRPRRSSNPPEP